MTEKCEKCDKEVTPFKKETKCFEETIVDYKCPNCNHTLRTVTIKN